MLLQPLMLSKQLALDFHRPVLIGCELFSTRALYEIAPFSGQLIDICDVGVLQDRRDQTSVIHGNCYGHVDALVVVETCSRPIFLKPADRIDR